MPSFAPSYLASWTGGQWTHLPALPLQGFTQDSRKLRAGQVFVALRDKRDGHEFLRTAMEAGASAAVVSQPQTELSALPQLVVADTLRAFQIIAREHRRAFRGTVTGVTGSAGKTSTKNLLARLLGGEPHVLATEGNLNNHIGVPLTLTRLEPGAHEAAVIEAGISAPGEMTTLASMIEPDYGIVTLVAPAHTAELGGLEGVAREKAVLLQHIRPSGLGVFPKQCWDFAPFQDLPQTSIVVAPEGESVTAPRVVYYGVRWLDTRAELTIGRRRFEFPRVTRGMAQNVALAVVLASEIGVSDDALQRALIAWSPAKWRGELLRDGSRLLYLDFYNANPASMADALENFYGVAPESDPRIFVLGCMEELGDEAPKYHRELGRSLRVRAQDQVYVIGGEAESVYAGALEQGTPKSCIEVITTLDGVSKRLADFSGSVFIKGSRRYELEKALPPSTAASAPIPASERVQGSGGGGSPIVHGFSGSRSPVGASTGWQFPRSATRISASTRWGGTFF